MIKQIKIAVKKSIVSVLQGIASTRPGRSAMREVLRSSMDKVGETSHNGVQLRFAIPNELCEWRVKTYSTKEPEMLEWIERLPEGAVLWDIGANVGLYSIYAAKKRNCTVYSFEPSVFNLELLARNVWLNNVTDKVCIVPLAVCDQLSIAPMRMTSTDWGGALSSFGKEFGWDGKRIKQLFEYRMIGLSMEDAVQKLNIPLPGYIKMDVDGLEHFILRGGASILAQIKEIIIEVNDDFTEQAEQCAALLQKAGLVMKEKRHSDMIAESVLDGFQNSYNQVWARS